MYFSILNNLAQALKRDLVKELNEKHSLTVKDYVKVFCESFERNDAFQLFRNFDIESDKMYVGIFLRDLNNYIYVERNINIEDVDEVYELRLELNLNLPVKETKRNEYYEIERDQMGEFFIQVGGEGHFYDKKYIHYSDYVENVLSSDIMVGFIDLLPDNIDLILNANH